MWSDRYSLSYVLHGNVDTICSLYNARLDNVIGLYIYIYMAIRIRESRRPMHKGLYAVMDCPKHGQAAVQNNAGAQAASQPARTTKPPLRPSQRSLHGNHPWNNDRALRRVRFTDHSPSLPKKLLTAINHMSIMSSPNLGAPKPVKSITKCRKHLTNTQRSYAPKDPNLRHDRNAPKINLTNGFGIIARGILLPGLGNCRNVALINSIRTKRTPHLDPGRRLTPLRIAANAIY